MSVDLDLLEAGRAAVADGRVWSFSALVNEALRRHLDDQEPHVVADESDRPIAIYGGVGRP